MGYGARRSLSAGALALFFLIIIAPGVNAGVQKQINKEFDVSPNGQLTIETDIGSVEVVSGESNKVEIVVNLEADTGDRDRAGELFDEFKIDFEQQGDDVDVYAEYEPKRRRWGLLGRERSLSTIEFLIRVPRIYNIEIETRGGSIRVGDLEGDVQVMTSGGSLSFDNIDGYIRGRTSGGSIDLASCTGTVDVKTSGGSISIGRVTGDVEAHTSGGGITVEEAFGVMNASTSGGSIQARLLEQPRDDCRLSTSGGSVTVYVSEDIAVDLDAETSSGRVKIDFPVKMEGKISDSAVRGSLNGGGPELYLRTSGGNIRIREI